MDLESIKRFVEDNKKGLIVGFVAALVLRSLIK